MSFFMISTPIVSAYHIELVETNSQKTTRFQSVNKISVWLRLKRVDFCDFNPYIKCIPYRKSGDEITKNDKFSISWNKVLEKSKRVVFLWFKPLSQSTYLEKTKRIKIRFLLLFLRKASKKFFLYWSLITIVPKRVVFCDFNPYIKCIP